jgi:hypothetical protein
MVTTTDSFDSTVIFWLGALSHSGPGPYNAPFCGLIVGNPQFTKATTDIDPTNEPAFPGYARQPLLNHTTIRNSAGFYTASWDPVEFRPTDGTMPTTVTGWFLAASLTAGFYAWEFFPGPIALPDGSRRLGVVCAVCVAAPPSGQGQTFN